MNTKLLVIAGILIVVVAFSAAGVGWVAAQTPAPTPQPFGYGGMMNGYGGMMNGDGAGPMHEAMFNALAEGLGLSREELDERVANGETPYQIALSLGFTQTEFYTLMTDARNSALDDAVTNGALTQEQTDGMRNRMSRFGGNCPHLNQNAQPNS
jgi:hypothetical protein